MKAEPDASRLLCKLAELAETGCREFRLGSGEWPLRGFVIDAGGEVRAYVNRCAHLRYPLNYIEDRFVDYSGEYIECFVHGALFEKTTGLCVHGPCMGQSLAALRIEVRDDAVWLSADQDPEQLAARYA